jgi:hypothetical protein
MKHALVYPSIAMFFWPRVLARTVIRRASTADFYTFKTLRGRCLIMAGLWSDLGGRIYVLSSVQARRYRF